MTDCHQVRDIMLTTLQIRLKNPEKEWETTNAWFVRQTGIDVLLARRGLQEVPH
jgi:hypothetical protein